MAVRLKRYFNQCKDMSCNGRRGKQCPEIPKRQNGQYKTCSAWAVELRDLDGKWVSLVFPDVKSKTDAEKRYSVLISDVQRGMLNLPTRKHVPTFAEYSKTYLELCKKHREHTLTTKQSAINMLTRHLGDYPLDKITSFIVEKSRMELREKDGIKDSSVNLYVNGILSHVFNTAIREGILNEGQNPCKKVYRLKIAQGKDKLLGTDEIKRLFEIPDTKDRLMLIMGLFTGMRLGEVLRLKWQDIDFAKGLITFVQHKTGKLITMPISGYMAGELLRFKGDTTEGMIFEIGEITKNVSNSYSRYFSDLFKSMGIDATFHSLRHTFSSLLQSELGVGATVVQGMTGHSSLSMLQRYSHTGLDHKAKAIEELTQHVLGNNREKVLKVAN